MTPTEFETEIKAARIIKGETHTMGRSSRLIEVLIRAVGYLLYREYENQTNQRNRLMAFDNETNHGRVQKILTILDLITKSAEANEAEEPEMIHMLQPLLDKIGVPHSVQEVVQPAPKVLTGNSWMDSVQMAREAPLEDVTAAMTVYLTRLEQEFYERRSPKS